MKQAFILISLFTLALSNKMIVVHHNDGSAYTTPLSSIDSVTFVDISSIDFASLVTKDMWVKIASRVTEGEPNAEYSYFHPELNEYRGASMLSFTIENGTLKHYRYYDPEILPGPGESGDSYKKGDWKVSAPFSSGSYKFVGNIGYWYEDNGNLGETDTWYVNGDTLKMSYDCNPAYVDTGDEIYVKYKGTFPPLEW